MNSKKRQKHTFKNYGAFGSEKQLTKRKEYAVYAYDRQGELVGFGGAIGYKHMLEARHTMSRDRNIWIKFHVNTYQKAKGR